MPLSKPAGVYSRQDGAALLVIMLVLALTIASVLLTGLDRDTSKINSDKRIASDLSNASQAIQGYKLRVALGGLVAITCSTYPCADTNNDGVSNPPAMAGEFPWKTVGAKQIKDSLGLPFDYIILNATTFQLNVKPIP